MSNLTAPSPIRVKQKLGKYRIERRLDDGGFAAVYQAFDTLEGIRVALKIPHETLLTSEVLEAFRHEVRLAARLKHARILPLKNAEFIGPHLVLAYPLGQRTLADRLLGRISVPAALAYAEQLLEAVVYAHQHRIIHCDIKPENVILFPDDGLMLADFGIAKVALRTVRASGSGTLGYLAPEQAMGQPSFRSDVFSIGLILYRMLTGHLPEWPFEWPPPGYDRIRRRLHPDLLEVIRRSIAFDPKRRYKDAGRMLDALRPVKARALRYRTGRSRRAPALRPPRDDWRRMKRKQFLRQYGRALEARWSCTKCAGPVSEPMHFCPWCAAKRSVHREETPYPQRCPRCHRGLKLDWRYCPHCFGPGFDVATTRRWPDARYVAKCRNAACERRLLMPFMRYCPWCRRKVQRKWKLPGSTDRCGSCGWGVVKAFWSHCPWCGRGTATGRR